MRRIGLPFLLAVLVIGLGTAAQENEAGFTLGLKKVQTSVRSRKWNRALDQLKRLLAAHENRDYVLARRTEIVDLHRHCLFRSRNKEPKPDDVVSGDLLSHDLSTGRIKIRYGPLSMGDFKGAVGLQLHTAKFAGPYSVEIRGKKYPGWLGINLPFRASSPPCIWVCMEGENGFIVSYGFEQKGDGRYSASWIPARIASAKKGAVVAEKGMTLARSGKPFRLKVKVGKTLISSYYNGKPLLKTRKPEKLFGGWGFANIKKFDEIVIQGKAEPSWLQGRIDAAVEKQRKVFNKSYRPEMELPPWLLRRPEPPVKPITKEEAPEYPGPEPDSSEERILDRASALVKKHDYRKCLDFLARLDPDCVDEARLAFLKASCHVGLGNLERSLPLWCRVCEEDPTFMPAQAKRIQVTYLLGRRDEALKSLKTLIEAHPTEGALHAVYVLLLLKEGRAKEAGTALEAALGQAGPSPTLERLRKLIFKATRGPNWGRVHEHKSEHYHVLSDIDRQTCREAARILEDSYRAYNVHLKRLKGDSRRFKVYLFSGQAGFRTHCRDAMGGVSMHTAGLYSPLLKQLLIWNLPDRRMMMRTVRHEGFHQYVDRIMRDPPIWFNEGMAEYYETADHVKGTWQIGMVRKDHLKLLKNLKVLIPLEDFIRLPAHSFYRRSAFAYAQAWAVVHFMLHGPKTYRSVFSGLFEELQGDEPGRVVLNRVLDAIDLEVMETEFRLYLKKLARSQ